MSNPYPAGQLFIRVKSPIAILIILAGVIQATLLLASWVSEIKQLRYQPPSELKTSLAKVVAEQTAAHDGVIQFLNQSSIKATLPLIVDLPDTPRKLEEFNECAESLKQLRQDSAELKKLLSAHIDSRLVTLSAAMQAYVERRRKEKNTSSPATALPVAPPPPPRLFTAGDKAVRASQRAAELAAILAPLEARASDPVNRQNLASVTVDLNALAAWLAKQEHGPEAPAKTPEVSLDSERILQQVQEGIIALKRSTGDAWLLDASLDQLEKTLETERRHCQDTLEKIEKSRFDHLSELASILLHSLLGAAAVLIFADFLKAHFANASRDSKGAA